MNKRLSTAPFHVQYTGDGLVRLGRAGIFQPGTTAWVDQAAAEAARAHGQFLVSGPGLGALAEQMISELAEAAPEPPAPAPPPPPAPVIAAAPEPGPVPPPMPIAPVAEKPQPPRRGPHKRR